MTVGHVGFGHVKNSIGSPGKKIHDGDTIEVRAIGDFGIRFLGVDAAEVSCQLKGSKGFPSMGSEKWVKYLTDPFVTGLPTFRPKLSSDLLSYLKSKSGPDAANNHLRHAGKARDTLVSLVNDDMSELDVTKEDFKFFIVFVWEVMDRYGRFLGYINRDQPKDTVGPRPDSYNERLLKMGKICPYFIWPNIDPFIKKASIKDAVIKPGEASKEAEKSKKLSWARAWVKENRDNNVGIFDEEDPLLFEPFEIRYLGRRKAPDRWIIDLSKDDDTLVKPQNYYSINMEDRLFVNEEFLPLFQEKGWAKQS